MAYNPITGQYDDSTDQYSTEMPPGEFPQEYPTPQMAPPQGQVYTTPGYVQPAPGPNASAPRAGVNPSVIYTDPNGNGYDLPALQAKLRDPAFANDPANARVGDIIKSYANPAPTAASGSGTTSAPVDYSALFGAAPNPLAGRDTSRSDAVFKNLSDLFSNGGGFNQDLVNRRTEAAREDLNRQRQSTLKNDRAYLADRGILGQGTDQTASGPEADALNYLDTNVGNAYKNAVSNIYANESQNADARMIQALSLATGMSEKDATDIINGYEAQTARALGLGNFTLGEGNLALNNVNAANNYNLGVANYGLQRDLAQAGLDNQSIDRLIQLIQELGKGAQTSANGYF